MSHEPRDPDQTGDLPRVPIRHVIDPVVRFMHVEAASGVFLMVCIVVALVLANSPLSDWFLSIWKTKVGFKIGGFEMIHSLKHWINDGLMVLFFFVVGLEVKREIVMGELRDPRRAALPVAAALGGMIVPAAIYIAVVGGGEGARGWGIPMATDIAIVVGCMALISSRIPRILSVMMLSLAIVDDIGAILVIAVGYTDVLDIGVLALGFVGLLVVWALGRSGVRSFGVYIVVGVLVWLAFHESGVHATIAGVLLGLMTPARHHVSEGRFTMTLERATAVLKGGGWETLTGRASAVRQFRHAARETIPPLEYLEGTMHPWTSFVIMPIFALANAGIPIDPAALGDVLTLSDPVGAGVLMGLVVGKPVGVFVASWLAVVLVLKKLPEGLTWASIFGGGCLAGIGFTMAIFIAELAVDESLLVSAKLGVVLGSGLAAVLGMAILVTVLKKPAVVTE